MSSGVGTGLARVTVASAQRRVDIALPDHVPAAELMPGLLRHAGDGLADAGQEHGGWVLRRADGGLVDPTQSLSAQGMRDGEVLHLTPRYGEWPELDYDDVVDAVATGARSLTRTWTGAATRRAGVTVSVVAILLALGLALSAGPDWTRPGAVILGLTVVLLAAAVGLSRALGDAGSGAAVGTVACVCGFAGGLTVFNGHAALTGVGPHQLLAGSAVLLVTALLGYVGVADRTQWFVAGIHIGVFGIAAALIGLTDLRVIDIAGIVVSAVVVLAPILPLLSIRLGKLPVPALPASAEDLLNDQPRIPRPRVYAAVRRSDELLTGLLMGSATVGVIAQILLVLDGRTSALVLVALVAVALLLQARLFPTLRHRTPLLAAGAVGLTALVGRAGTHSVEFRLAAALPVLVVLAGLVLAAARQYQHRPPGPYLGRIADILDVLIVIAVVPVTCVLVGLVAYMRHLGG